MPRVRTAIFIDKISASGVEWETQLCFLVLAAMGHEGVRPDESKEGP